MSENALISFSFAGLPAGYCFTSAERFALDIAGGLQGYLPGTYSTIIRSSTEPIATDRNKVWYQVNADGASTGRVFTYAYGKWVMQNPRRNSAERVWFEGSEAEAWSYDGGDGTDPSSNPPTATTGAMWEVDENYSFRFPLGAGTSPKPTTVSVGDTGGEEEHVLTMGQLPKGPFRNIASGQNDGVNTIWGSSSDGTKTGPVYGNDHGLAQTGTQEIPIETVVSPGNDDPITNMPPWRAGFWLKPTQRQFFTP